MLMQPFSLALYGWSFAVTLAGTVMFIVGLEAPGVRRHGEIDVQRPAARPSASSSPCGTRPSPCDDGQFVCLLGPVGLRQDDDPADDRRPRAADLRADPPRRRGRDASSAPRQRDIAFVFQLFALYPHMNVRAEHRVPACATAACRAPRSPRRVAEAARILRIEHLLDRSVSGLSAGDRQRVALGRAIVREPAAFMMDEPLGALDAEFRHLMCGELRALHDRLKATTVYVTHDQLEAMAMADRIAVMNHGVIEQFGPPQEIYDRPATCSSPTSSARRR